MTWRMWGREPHLFLGFLRKEIANNAKAPRSTRNSLGGWSRQRAAKLRSARGQLQKPGHILMEGSAWGRPCHIGLCRLGASESRVLPHSLWCSWLLQQCKHASSSSPEKHGWRGNLPLVFHQIRKESIVFSLQLHGVLAFPWHLGQRPGMSVTSLWKSPLRPRSTRCTS